jgi:hypothetical protein
METQAMMKTLKFAALALALLAIPLSSASAGIYVGIGRPYYRPFYRPFYGPRVVIGVPPVYIAPQPVYVQPAPVYVQPAPVYAQPGYAPQVVVPVR